MYVGVMSLMTTFHDLFVNITVINMNKTRHFAVFFQFCDNYYAKNAFPLKKLVL